MLELKNVTYQYEGTAEGMKDVSLSIGKDHIYAIIGKSGAGKTTLLRCLGRFLPPQSGDIFLDGVSIQSLEEKELRRRVGIVFQHLYLFPHLTVMENLLLAPVKAHGMNEDAVRQEAQAMMESFGIAELAAKYPAEISGGQAQRVAICRSMILKPEYLLLDEPTAALDVETTREFGAFLQGLTSETSFIVVTHDVEFVQNVATQGALMMNGGVVGTGNVTDLIQKLSEKTL